MAIVFDPNIRFWQYKDSGTVRLTKNVIEEEPLVNVESIDTTVNINDKTTIGNKTSYYDIDDIDVRNCTFSEFCKAIKFVKENCSTISYDEKLLNSFSNQFAEDEKMDFYQFFDDYGWDCVKKGNIQLYHQIFTIEQAAYNIYELAKSDHSTELTSEGTFKTNVFNDQYGYGYYNDYRLGQEVLDIDGRLYHIFAEYDVESTKENPIIAVQIGFIKNEGGLERLNGTYVVDISTVDLKNATPIELFAYESYMTSKDKENWEQEYNNNSNFKKLFRTGAFEISNVEDLATKKYNLKDVVEKAKSILQEVKENNSKPESLREQLTVNFTDKYIDECLEIFDKILESLSDDEETDTPKETEEV